MEAKLHNWVRCLGCKSWVKKAGLIVVCGEKVTQCCQARYETPQEVAAKGELPKTGPDEAEFTYDVDIQSNKEIEEEDEENEADAQAM